MYRLPLNLKQEDLTRSPLRLIAEAGEGSGYRSAALLSADQVTPSGDPFEDERVRHYMVRRQREIEINRARRIQRLRKLARMDFKLVGGVAPVGFFGGSGGGDVTMRPSSMSARM